MTVRAIRFVQASAASIAVLVAVVVATDRVSSRPRRSASNPQASATSSVRRVERGPSSVRIGGFRSGDLAVGLDERGEVRIDRDRAGSLSLSVRAMSRGEPDRSDAASAELQPPTRLPRRPSNAPGAVDAPIALDRGPLVEWWSPAASGIEHGFDLPTRVLEGDAPLAFELALEGLRLLHLSKRDALFASSDGTRFTYGDLAAQDAHGRALDAWFESSDERLVIRVDDREAVYPIVIDPLLAPTSAWRLEGGSTAARLGSSVAYAGDVDGDGFGDFVVGAPGYSSGEVDEGRVLFFRGGQNGPTLAASFAFESDQAGAELGASVAGVGDVDGDGFADVAVGAPGFDDDQADEGRVFLFLGSATGLVPAPSPWFDGNRVGARFGSVVAGLGDVDADGRSDVGIGAPEDDAGGVSAGRFVVLGGSISGLDTLPLLAILGTQSGAHLGAAVAGVGDLDGDGFADLAVGAPGFDDLVADEGAVEVYVGSSRPLAPTFVRRITGGQAGAALGSAIARAGDVNGDGYADLAIGVPGWDGTQVDEGRILVHAGSSAGVGAIAAQARESNVDGARFGASLATAGDVDGDGFADLIVGAPAYDDGASTGGAFFLFAGGPTGLGASAEFARFAAQAGAGFGSAVASAGDVNADGFADLLVGAPSVDAGFVDAGAVDLHLGHGRGLSKAPVARLEGLLAGGFHGAASALVGDVNADGFGDLLIGEYGFEAGQIDEGRVVLQFGSAAGIDAGEPDLVAQSDQAAAQLGRAVAGLGDVDGDGYEDFAAGAPYYDVPGASDAGAVFVYRGGPGTAANPLSSSPATLLLGNQAGALFGMAVAGAGDVNGDGYADVVVGSPKHDTSAADAGRIDLFLGSSRGLATSPAFHFEGAQAYAWLGGAVAGAGDVDGDGLADLVVGARGFGGSVEAQGAVFVFRGAPTGVSSTPLRIDGGQMEAAFGASVAGAGDVNGDGYADVVVGAPLFDGGSIDEGRVLVYRGSAAGLVTTPWAVRERDQAGALFGVSVASAGDVDADGFADLVVGASSYSEGDLEEGGIWVYHGASAGLATLPGFAFASDHVQAALGTSVSGAGDVNGDGFSDVVGGAPGYASAGSAVGATFVFLGGNAPGLAEPPTPRWIDGYSTAALPPGGKLDGTRLRATLRTATPYGLVALRLEVETETGILAFDGAGTTRSVSGAPSHVAGTASVQTLDVDPLALGTRHHARMRWTYGAEQALPQVAGRWFVAGVPGHPRGVHLRTTIADADGDGDAGLAFGGTDCDDDRASVHVGASDTGCDGFDDDCDGTPDQDFVAGASSCGLGACASVGTTACVGGVLLDSCVPGSPGLDDADCDAVDDDCSGAADEDFVAVTTSCGLGACSRGGATSCVAGAVVDSCTPGSPALDDADCDAVDDDCNGTADEDFVAVTTSCGLGACSRGGATSCMGGVVVDSCLPGSPAPSDADCDAVDDDCNGAADEDFVTVTTTCGVGVCSSTGLRSCVAGALVDSCAPASGGADDDCDGVDDDCDGTPDDGFAGTVTTCGVGACMRSGMSACSLGFVVDSCLSGSPAPIDADCDGIDDDCDGSVDEDAASCVAPDAGVDAGTDAGADAGSDAGTDAGSDGSMQDGAIVDGGADGGGPPPAATGCACSIPGDERTSSGSDFSFLVLVGMAWALRGRARGARDA